MCWKTRDIPEDLRNQLTGVDVSFVSFISNFTPMPSIILFDGICNLCNGFVQFVIKRDPRGIFQFASLQSPPAARLLTDHPELLGNKPDTVVLIENGAIYTHSDVALRVASKLGGVWSVCLIGYVLPKPIRDWIYRLVARNRYRWFGKKEQCMVPTPAIRKRFLID